MSAVWKALDWFWKQTEKSDNKNHSTQTEPEGIARVYDLAYIDDGHRLHLLDVYYPEKHEGKLPVIIDIHGGGWMYGDKELNRFYNLELAARGFCVFSMSYRLAPEVTVNEQLQDCMTALKWIQDRIGDYPADEKNIMLTGDSAGGMLAGYCACLLESESLRTVFAVENPGMHLKCLTLTSPAAYMNDTFPVNVYTRLMWGYWKSKPTVNYMNISDLLDKTTLPPTLLITSSGDFLARSQTVKLAGDLKSRHIPCKIVDYPPFEGKHLPHVFAVLKPASKAGVNCISIMENYFRKVISL